MNSRRKLVEMRGVKLSLRVEVEDVLSTGPASSRNHCPQPCSYPAVFPQEETSPRASAERGHTTGSCRAAIPTQDCPRLGGHSGDTCFVPPVLQVSLENRIDSPCSLQAYKIHWERSIACSSSLEPQRDHTTLETCHSGTRCQG